MLIRGVIPPSLPIVNCPKTDGCLVNVSTASMRHEMKNVENYMCVHKAT